MPKFLLATLYLSRWSDSNSWNYPTLLKYINMYFIIEAILFATQCALSDF